MPPDPLPPPDGQPGGETLARFAVVLAAHRGQLAALDGKVERLSETVQALSEGTPKGPPMIAWHDLGPDEATAVRADLAQWVDQVLFPLYPSARESVRDCWDKHPDAVTRTVRLLAGVPPDLRPRRPGRTRQANGTPPLPR